MLFYSQVFWGELEQLSSRCERMVRQKRVLFEAQSEAKTPALLLILAWKLYKNFDGTLGGKCGEKVSVMPNVRETFFRVVMHLACICPMNWCSQGGFILSCALSFSSSIIACLFKTLQ
jgi:hypothetical protein